ncbi:MAG: hypothetical protein V7603_2283 [Micromonosporaceae bacterium]
MATLLVTLIAGATLAAAGLAGGFARDVLLNVGASLALVPPTYLVFAPIFERLRQTAAAIQEHVRLDRGQLTGGIRGSRWRVEMMATWSSMLEDPYREEFLASLAAALHNGAAVRILLLNPDSFAVAQRTRELDGLDVRLLIGANLRHLNAFAGRLDPVPRRRLEMRIYDAAPSMQLFRWDDKVLISFFPLHQRVATARQIETYVSNPLGEFAQSRFDELWTADTTRSVEDHMGMLVAIGNAADTVATERVGFVRHLDQIFINVTPFVAHLVKHGIAGLRATLPTADGSPVLPMSQIESCPPDQRRQVAVLFESKYGEPLSPDVIVRLG